MLSRSPLLKRRGIGSSLFRFKSHGIIASSSFTAATTTTPLMTSTRRFASGSNNTTNNDSSSSFDPNMAEIQSTIEGASSSATSSPIQAGAFQPPTSGASSSSEAAQQVFMSSSAASQSAVDAATAASSKPALVSMVDSIWNTVAGAVSWIIPDFNPALDFGVSCVIGAQVATGLPWSSVFFLFGVCIRLSTLYFTMYGERASLRLQVALPEIKQAYHKFELTYYDPAASQKEIMQVTTKLQEEQKKVYSKHGTSNAKAFASLASGPVFVYGFWVAMRTAGLAPNLSTASFAWIPSLTSPDPFCILPLTVVGITVANFELFFAKKGGSKGTGISSNIVGGIRLVALSCLWAISNFRAAVLLYWAGVTFTGLLQPLLMRNPAFQKFWGVPTDAQMKRAVEEARQASLKAHEATVGRKSPTQSFMEKMKETRYQAKSGFNTPSSFATTGAGNTNKSKTTTTTENTDEQHQQQQQQNTEATEQSQQQSRPASYTITSSRGTTTHQQQQQGVPSYDSFLKSGGTPASENPSATKQGGSPSYRVLRASDLEEKQRKDVEAQAEDPLLQRLMMSMPMMSQAVVNPERNQKLADDIQNFNENQMEEAQRKRSWKSKTK